MKKILCALVCGLLCAALCACGSGPDKEILAAQEQLEAGDYSGARVAFIAIKTPQTDEMADYCSLMELLSGLDWTEGTVGEYSFSDKVTGAVRNISADQLDETYQGKLAAITAANDLYLKNVAVVDAAYTVATAQYTGLDEAISKLQTGYKRDSKYTFLAGDMKVQLDEWRDVTQAAVDTLHKTLPGITFTGLTAYQKQAITDPSAFWYSAIDGQDDNAKIAYNTYRLDWEQYYKPARTEINAALAPNRQLDYAAVWAAAYADIPLVRPTPAEGASSAAA